MFRTESRGSKLFLWYATTWWPRWGDQSAKIWKIKETTANKKLRSKLGTLWSETLYQWVYSIQYIKYCSDIIYYIVQSITSNISWILLNISLFLDSWLMEFSLGKIRRPAARRRAGNATRIFSLIFLITLSFETFNSQTFFSSCVPQVMQSNDLKVDESSLTGESDQVEMFFFK